MTDLHIEFNPQLDPAKSLPYTCYRCGKVWKAKPGMANVGCAVNHAPGTCCHYNETEVTGQAATGPQQGDGLKRLPQSDQVDTLDALIEEVLLRSYYRGKDKKGYSDFELRQDKRQLSALLVEAEIWTLKSCYVDQGEIYVRFKGGFAEQYDRIKLLEKQREETE